MNYFKKVITEVTERTHPFKQNCFVVPQIMLEMKSVAGNEKSYSILTARMKVVKQQQKIAKKNKSICVQLIC